MARLNAFRVNSKAIEAGAWIKPGDEYDDLEIQTRGFTDSYTDARATKTRRAAMPFGGDATKIPVAVSRGILVDCLIAHVLLDVRGLADESGSPILFPGFCDLLRNPDYAPLLTASIAAAAQVGQMRAADAADAIPNSGQPAA